MSFRYYLGYVPKKTIKEVENLSYKILCQKFGQDDCFRPYDIAHELYGLGSEFNTNCLKGSIRKLFKNKETHLKAASGDDYFYKISSKGFELIIEEYHNLILKGFQRDLERFHSTKDADKFLLEKSIQSKIDEWMPNGLKYKPYNLDKNLDLNKESSLIYSWKFEYAIFELVLKYKTFNWKENQLVIYGY